MNNPHFLKLSFTGADLEGEKFCRETVDDGTIYFIIDKDLARKIDRVLIKHEEEIEKEE
jgi:hypothetical protein